ncbi:hypothetical protein ACFVT8_14240 [Lysinibacillus sp. NPDC058147]
MMQLVCEKPDVYGEEEILHLNKEDLPPTLAGVLERKARRI